MLLSAIFSAFSLFMLAYGALASAVGPQQVVANINIVATASGNANDALSQISIDTPVSQVITMSQALVTDFNMIVSSLVADVTTMQTTSPFADNVTEPIVAALTNFVLIHQALLSTVIGKHGIFAQFLLTAPIAAVLRLLEAQIDAFALAMIGLIPTQTDVVQTGQATLDLSVASAIKLYNQICIPSLLYPTTMPICVTITL